MTTQALSALQAALEEVTEFAPEFSREDANGVRSVAHQLRALFPQKTTGSVSNQKSVQSVVRVGSIMGRAPLLNHLKGIGVSSLAQRQKIAATIAKAAKCTDVLRSMHWASLQEQLMELGGTVEQDVASTMRTSIDQSFCPLLPLRVYYYYYYYY